MKALITVGAALLVTGAAVAAGDRLEVDITSDPGTTVTMYFFDGYRASVRELTLAGSTGLLEAPSTRFAGRLDVVAVAGSRRATATTIIRPGDDIEPPVPLVGARSIVADGADRAMVAVIPTDRFGNPAPAGTPVAVTVQHPDRSLAAHETAVARTLAWTWAPSVTTAGTANVTVAASGQSGPSRTLVEIPSAPTPFGLEIETMLRPADGVSLVTVVSDPLVDRHGNRVVDGTAVVVQAQYPDGAESFQTVTAIGGVARALLEAPDRPGSIEVRMTVLDTTSSLLGVQFSAPLGGAPDGGDR